MNEEQLIEFVNWLPTAVPEFQNATPDQIVQSLNQMAESEEGQQMISQLFTAFQESKQAGNSQMFKKGGKMAAFVNKYGNGGCVSCKKKEILRGGMVNKIAEKMQDGGDAPKLESDKHKQTTSSYDNFKKLIDRDRTQFQNQRDSVASQNINTVRDMSQSNLAIDPHTGLITIGLMGDMSGRLDKISDLLNISKPSFVSSNQKGGELIPKAQGGLSLEPEVKPRGIRGWFWEPTFFPRIDTSAEVGENWTGKRATYYKPNGNLIQILTRKFPAGNTSETIRTIRNPFTPQADTTTIVRNSSSEDQRRVANDKFNEVFSRNFDKQNK